MGFMAQSMKETIQYDACDENNWSDPEVAAQYGGQAYPATPACGQLGQSYQDYACATTGTIGEIDYACPVDPEMTMRAVTSATWYGAPGPLFCAPKSKLPRAPRWDYSTPWCAPPLATAAEATYDSADAFLAALNDGSAECKEYAGQKAGGYTYAGCPAAGCENSPGQSVIFDQPSRTDLEGCCWWGRGVIQTTGVCNFGKLNYYIGARAAREGRESLYPDVDFCLDPEAICNSPQYKELKWIAGYFYWLNAVQDYDSGGWNYMDQLKAWVDNGASLSDTSFIDGASGIVNRGCHNPPACGTGVLDGAGDRRDNFATAWESFT